LAEAARKLVALQVDGIFCRQRTLLIDAMIITAVLPAATAWTTDA
jgi:hypothetical protein